MKTKSSLSLILLCVALTLSSCASTPSRKESTSPQEAIREMDTAKQVRNMNEKLMLSSVPSPRKLAQDYRIGPEDIIEISVFEDDKLNKTVRVSSQGSINLPLLGIIKVKGLTSSELEKELRDLLADKYLKDPHVSIFIKEYRNHRVSLLGAVSKAGVYDFSGPKTILDLLAMAGGLREDAGRLLFLVRPPDPDLALKSNNPDDQSPRASIVDLEDLLIKGDPNMNLTLQHGDIVNIPVAGKIFIGGEVKSPGAQVLTKKLTLRQAITAAGGMTSVASGSEAKIFRYSTRGTEKEVLTADLAAIQKGQAEDMFLRENDVIIVPQSGAKVALKEFWDLMKGPLFGFALW